MGHRIMSGSAYRASSVVFLLIGVSFLLFPANAAAKPRPNEDGLEYCMNKDSGFDDELHDGDYDSANHRCCYWEDQGGGEHLRVCLQCDENWKNCKETLGAHRPGFSTTTGNLEIAPSSGASGSGSARVCCKLRGHYGGRPLYRLVSRSVCLRRRGVPVGQKYCSKKSTTPQPARICCRTRRSHALMSPQQCRARRGRQASLKLCRNTGRPEYRRQRRPR